MFLLRLTCCQLHGPNGQVRLFRVPFAHPAIIRLIEVILLELQYHRFVFFDDSDRWKTRLRNVFAIGGTLCRWLMMQYSTGLFIAAELATKENADYYDGLVYTINRFDPDQQLFFDALLVDVRAFLTPASERFRASANQ